MGPDAVMSSSSDRFRDAQPNDSERADAPSANGPSQPSQQHHRPEESLTEAERRQLRLDAIKQAIEDGVYDHEDLLDRALKKMVDRIDLDDEPPQSESE